MTDNGTDQELEEKEGQPEEIAMISFRKNKGENGDFSDEEGMEPLSCGVGSFRPKHLQIFSGIWTFTAIFGLSTLLTSSLRTYLTTQIMGLERQYQFSSQTTGALVSCSDFGFLSVVVLLSFFARRWHIPKVLSLSLIVFGVGALICVIPHAATQNDLLQPPNIAENDTYSIEKLMLNAPSCTLSKLPLEFISSMTSKLVASGNGQGSPPVKNEEDNNAMPIPAKDEDLDPAGSSFNVDSKNASGVTSQPVQVTTKSSGTPLPTSIEMLNFTKLAAHPKYEHFVQMAKTVQIDLKKVAAMAPDEQINYVVNLPPDIRAMLPNMKMMLGDNADSYFYSVPLPTPSPGRRKRDVSNDLMHSGALSQMMKNMPPIPDSLIDEMSRLMCPFNTGNFFHNTERASIIATIIIGFGMFIQGVARGPQLTFATIYIDDNVEETQSGLPLGIILGLGTIGTAFAYGLGGLAAFNYVTLEDTGFMTVFNPRWLGAWWLGFLIYGILALLLAIPLIMFPRYMPHTTKPYKEEPKKAKTKLARISKELKGLFQGLMRLIGNPVFVLLTAANAVTVLSIAGVFVFLPKYLENQFSLMPFQTSIILSFVYVLAATLGTVIGGIATTKGKLSPLNSVKMVVIISCILVVVQALGMVLGCDQPQIDMGDKIVGNTSTELCNSTCVCVKQMYAPVCGSDGISYYSACHAGCGEAYDGKFHDCKCIDDNIKTATPMLCEQPCNFLLAFCAVLVVGGFLLHLKAIPSFIATYRCVEARDAPLAIGLNAVLTTVAGYMPSPVIFGAVFDATCSYHRAPCGFLGSCAFYNIEQLRLHFHGLSTGLGSLAAIIYVGALLLGLRRSSVFSHKIHQKEWRK